MVLSYQGPFLHNPQVEGSNPSPATKFLNHIHTISSSFPALKGFLSVFLFVFSRLS